MQQFVIGQCWISEMEPELGLGIVIQLEPRFVVVRFEATETTRKYAISSAPLKRVQYQKGDQITSAEGKRITTDSVESIDGLFYYHGDGIRICESEINPSAGFTTPRDRLFKGFIDRNSDFDLRYRAWMNRARLLSSQVRGFLGGRIDLLPHQIYVAGEIVKRHIPRVLLSDETGLGKTIEVCLILHHLLLTGRINRILILLPGSLINQWFIELYRRFNLVFNIFDNEYCIATTDADAKTNPFLEAQSGLCEIDFLAQNKKWRDLAVAAGWDMVVVDEAHHLDPESTAFQMVKSISKNSNGLILVTATPEQLGHERHFKRLQLLDAARFHDFKQFEAEYAHYRKTSGIVDHLLEHKKLTKREVQFLSSLLNKKQGEINILSKQPDELVGKLSDLYGPGRAIFRNTRLTVKGFPKRIPHLYPLPAAGKHLAANSSEFLSSGNNEDKRGEDLSNDPRISWLISFLDKNRNEKVLLICRTMTKVLAIEAALRAEKDQKMVLFHEGLSLLQRDRNAAWFAEKNGAQLMLCSEIGSEGRNFQFSHHLVLFDLPPDPELLEQRIGRLDRIGQSREIHIHIPFLKGSEYEILVRWYHEGLNAFVKNIPGIYHIYRILGEEIWKLAVAKDQKKIPLFIEKTKDLASEIGDTLSKGRDRLLEINSYDSIQAGKWIKEIKDIDEEIEIREFILSIFSLMGISETKIAPGIFKLDLTYLTDHSFPLPLLNKEEPIITFSRKKAIAREEIEFISWDHPLVTGILDFLLGTEKGNCAASFWPDESENEILIEAIFIIEGLAPKKLNIHKFLPPTPIRVLINHELINCSHKYPSGFFHRQLKPMADISILENRQVRTVLLPGMLNKCDEIAEDQSKSIIEDKLAAMQKTITSEIDRLVELQQSNPNVLETEIEAMKNERELLSEAMSTAQTRLDALRLIVRGNLI